MKKAKLFHFAMAELCTDNAIDSYGEDPQSSGHGFRDKDFLNWVEDVSQTSSGYTELCGSVLQNNQKNDSPSSTQEEKEDLHCLSSTEEGKQYLALSTAESTDACYGSPEPPVFDLTGNSLTDSVEDGVWTYSPSDGLRRLTDSADNAADPSLESTPSLSYSYWAEGQGESILSNLLSPPLSPQPLSRVSSSADFLNTVKACVAIAIREVVLRLMKEECFGCQIDHPSQVHHPCLYPPDPGYFERNFERLMNNLLSWEFLPALKSTLEKKGLDVEENRVSGAADAFIHDLKPEENILERVNEITESYTAQGEEREILLNHFIDFWKP